jgi:hypothetical protein
MFSEKMIYSISFFLKRGSVIFLSGKNRRTKQLSKERVTYEIEE